MSRTKHTITAPRGVFRSKVSSPYSLTETGKPTYASYRNQIKPWVVVYTLNGGGTWAINSWHSRRDLAEKENRRINNHYANSQAAEAVIIRASY
jgi:hypothetical protein